ncbi:hypothetical protein L2E82_48483 [Cichorium intybus]|uniref:Uncharacterized protein n=1 Tax=Cichorium intybus TaxID=13427 RepID=A0ACB8YXJ6_CICIN|nr:hypothetical protein L2E82_48483 [Cichorium intybus]
MMEVVTQLETALEYQLSTALVRTHQDKAQRGFEVLKSEKVDFRRPERQFLTRGVDEGSSIQNLPKDLRRHICFSLVKRVPLFKDMNERLLDDICERLKPCLFTSNTYIIEEGDPVDQMLFIVRGCLEITTAYGWSSGFLEEGDYCCEELLTWALDPKSGANIPSSGRTLRALKDVEAFALPADEIKFVVSQFRRQRPRQVQHAFRFFSQNWRTWAACFIQANWRRYCKRKEKAHKNLKVMFLAVRFAAKLLLGVHRNRNLNSDSIIAGDMYC